jgi:hypothetical protein
VVKKNKNILNSGNDFLLLAAMGSQCTLKNLKYNEIQIAAADKAKKTEIIKDVCFSFQYGLKFSFFLFQFLILYVTAIIAAVQPTIFPIISVVQRTIIINNAESYVPSL